MSQMKHEYIKITASLIKLQQKNAPFRLKQVGHQTGTQDATEIYHVWYFAESERAVVKLQVNSASWRTYSSKIIQPHEIGESRVDVLGPEGEVLKAVRFEIAP